VLRPAGRHRGQLQITSSTPKEMVMIQE
jgi:hypothetical protein